MLENSMLNISSLTSKKITQSLETGKEKNYVGIILYWDHQNHHIHLSIPVHIKAAIQCFNKPIPTRHQGSTFPHTPQKYGSKIHYIKEPETTELFNEKGNKFIQRISGTLLYLSRAVDITLLTPLSAITSQQSKPMATTMKWAL